MTAAPAVSTPPRWDFPAAFGARSLIALIAALALLWYSGQRVEVGRMLALTGEAVAAQVGLAPRSQVNQGLGTVLSQLFPIQLSERREASRIDGFDPDNLPFLAYLEVVEAPGEAMNPVTLRMEPHPVRTTWLVEPIGYVGHVALKMLETLEIALWGTVVAIVLGWPLAMLGARNITSSAPVRTASRLIVGFLRAVPELISALFLLIAFGFGPIAGFLALGIYGAGFLGKFYAEDMENADPRPQEALTAMGVGRMAMWRFAILPQVLPQWIAYTLYILDRNVRMATVIGIVGAGGIGQELKGRYDMYEYAHVGTILIAILLVVLLLDHATARLRKACM